MNDIAQIKKDVHDIHDAIHNNNTDNKNNIFDSNTKESDLYNNYVIDNTITLMDKQIKIQEDYLDELEKQTNEYHEKAKQLLKEGDKNKSKNYLIKKKRCVDKIKTIEGILVFIEEQKYILNNSREMQKLLNTIKDSEKAIEEASKV